MEVIEVTEREIEIIEVIERGPQGPTGPTGPQGPAGAGGVTSVSGTAPIVSSGGTTPVISVTTGSTAGTVAAGDHTHTNFSSLRIDPANGSMGSLVVGNTTSGQNNYVTIDGKIRLLSPSNSFVASLDATALSADRAISLPNASGTIARTEDFAAPPAIGSTTRNSGAFTTLNATNGTLTASAPVLDLSQTWNNAAAEFHLCTLGIGNSTPWTASTAASTLFRIRLASSTVFSVGYTGTCNAAGLYIANGSATINGNIQLSSNVTFNAGTTTGFCDITSAVGCGLRLYNTGNASAANYERGFMRWSSNVLQIGTENAGTGSARNLELLTDNTVRARLQAEGLVLPSGALYLQNSSIDGRGDSNASIRLIPFSTGHVIITTGLLRMHGSSSSFPALKRSSTTLQVRLADDSADAPLSCGALTVSGNITHTGSLTLASTSTNNLIFSTNNTTRWQIGGSSGILAASTGVHLSLSTTSFLRWGSTASEPMFKRSSTAIQVRLADDSAFAPFECAGLTLNGNLTASTRDIVTDTTTGTRIGTGTTQLLGFWNATPAAQPAAVADATDAATVITQLNALLSRLRTIGIIAT